MMRLCPGILKFIVFFSKKKIAISQKNRQKTKHFFLGFAHFLPKTLIFTTQLPFVNRQLLLNHIRFGQEFVK